MLAPFSHGSQDLTPRESYLPVCQSNAAIPWAAGQESNREMVIAFSGRAGTGWRTDDASESLAAGAKISGAVRQQLVLINAVDGFKGAPRT